MLSFEEFREFLLYEMKMTFIYQPLVLKVLLENGGKATPRQIAEVILGYDEAQIDYYTRVVKRYPRQVLTRRGIISADRDGKFVLTLPIDSLHGSQLQELIDLCNSRVKQYVATLNGVVGDHRFNPDELTSSGTIRYEVLKRAKGRCALCGVSVDERALDVDHIVPRTRGGDNALSNLQALCYKCNRAKGNRDKTDFRSYGRDCIDVSCVFCNLTSRIVSVYNTAQHVFDLYPVSEGHSLIVPRRHVSDALELSVEETGDLFQLAKKVSVELRQDDKRISGFNIGFNVGATAGQSVDHAHLHVIPRRAGDVENPRGGIRQILNDPSGYNSHKP